MVFLEIACMFYWLGIDIGSTSSKAVAIDAKGAMLAQTLCPTGPDGAATARDLLQQMIGACHSSEPRATLATGYGRSRVDFADQVKTEIACHARGVSYQHPEARSVLDIGGQDAKVIRLGPGGAVEDFVMNDRCAAGTGSFLEMVARRFDISLTDLGQVWQYEPIPCEISSTCVVFAESEIVGLLARGESLNNVIAGVHRAIACRIAVMLDQARAEEPVYFSGGVAGNEHLRREVEEASGRRIMIAEHPQMAGAYGAALLARE
jgi:(R)-2-hydroxyacyl-CoA dehydratese activating ATPase